MGNPTSKKICGFKRFDKIRCRGKEYFIKNRQMPGYFNVMDITGKDMRVRPIPTPKTIIRLTARKTWMIEQKIINII
jgi:hypothetical protein